MGNRDLIKPTLLGSVGPAIHCIHVRTKEVQVLGGRYLIADPIQ